MRLVLVIISFLSAINFSSCTDESPLVPENDLVVVQAYLYAGESVNDIRLTSTMPLDADTTGAPPISYAEVFLVKNEQRYTLIPTAGRPGYYNYPQAELIVESGDDFQLEIFYNDNVISAETYVPYAPEGINISDTTLEVFNIFELGHFDRSLLDSAAIEVTWTNDMADLYFLVLDNIETNPAEIESNFPSFPKRFISQPISRDSFPINFRMVTHYGKHRVKLYKINQEYADLYQSLEQDSRDLNEPLTNVKNGLGIFSAFNCDSVFFDVVAQ